MSHPGLFELQSFVARGERSAAFERHVSGCAACAQKLSALARRRVAPAVTFTAVDPVEPRLQAAFVTLIACLAVLLVRTVTWHPPADVVAPEGVHGSVVFTDAGVGG